MITVGVSLVVALINVVFGTLIAWVLVRRVPREGFRQRDHRPSVRVADDRREPRAAVAVRAELAGRHPPERDEAGAGRRLTFVTLPFVVRQVQPVLLELDTDVEEAAAVLGASNRVTFTKIVLPALLPAILTGAGLAFTRAIGEFGSVVLIGGNIPGDTQVASQYIQQQIEIDEPVNAAAISVVLLLIAFLALFVLRIVGRRQSVREDHDR